MKTFVVETFNNLCEITVADAQMKYTDLMYIYVYVIVLAQRRGLLSEYHTRPRWSQGQVNIFKQMSEVMGCN